jgi:indolepyruvate ferredoxin oxidoreductase alpha subunit
MKEIGREIALMLGNEAIARGAIEGDVKVATAYPGTPSTEVVETLASLAKEFDDLYVEWSVNEKVAFEVALAASYCNLRALTAMKHVGLNVASDPLFTSAYTGVKGGFVIVSADDPSCHSSQNEQDNRIYGLHAYVPVVEPSSPQEAKDLTIYSLEVSESYGAPVILRTVTRLSHARGPVELGPVNRSRRRGTFERRPEKLVCLPANARRMRLEAIERLRAVEGEFERSKFNAVEEGDPKVGIIACGLAYAHVLEALEHLNPDRRPSVLKLSTIHPLPRSYVARFLEDKEKVLVVEELEPLIELQVKALCHDLKLEAEVHGKDLIPLAGELTPLRVLKGLASFLGASVDLPEVKLAVQAPPRPPILCAGCPHRSTFYAIKMAVKKAGVDAIYPSDIGCYTLGYYPPFELVDTTICMGAGVGLSCGFAKFTDKVVIATVGESTFYHACIPGLINAVHNPSSFVLVVLDNNFTAMTGGQPSPATGVNAMGQQVKRVLPEDIARACGVEFCKVVDPYDVDSTISSIVEAIEYVKRRLGPAVVVARRPCSLILLREHRLGRTRLERRMVDTDKCKGCMACIKLVGCPALVPRGEKVVIDEDSCTGCGLCERSCPYKAIKVTRG